MEQKTLTVAKVFELRRNCFDEINSVHPFIVYKTSKQIGSRLFLFSQIFTVGPLEVLQFSGDKSATLGWQHR